MKTKNKIYRFLEVANDIEKELQGKAPHSPVPSLYTLVDRFSVSLTTAKRAMFELQKRYIIYSKVGAGSFVAPASPKNIILIVFHLKNTIKSRDMFNQEFLARALIYCNRKYRNYTVQSLDFNDFRRDIKSLESSYLNLKGIILLREIDEGKDGIDFFNKSELPICFYGSSTFSKKLKKVSSLIYNEGKIINTALDLIVKSKRKIIGYAKYDLDLPTVFHERHRQLKLQMKQKKIKSIPITLDSSLMINGKINLNNQDIKLLLRKFFLQIDAMVCFNDTRAIAYSNAAKELGFNLPDEILFIGIDNYYSYQIPKPDYPTVELNAGADAEQCIDLLMDQISTGKRFSCETNNKLILPVDNF